MSLFEKAGKTFEEAKRTFTDGTQAEYVCRSCTESVSENYEYCPHCGEETVDSVA
ncbi:zinc-ribbon domain-containing protein [Haloplanus pelagicus]|jgi:rRNA maturation endonuclease Nob1|uniref:zinc-ribbon domain-containing protein n=1 Tax=Haloplanus pelagicus TaxID=2949995 RepID=UPI00203EA79F|nr:zinc-ribbon domain-containing protein [Haloplanus sp. HW8-1]